MRHLPALFISVALLLTPLAIAVEHEFPAAWKNRLYLPEFISPPDYHTPLFTTGTYLPAVIRQDIILTADHNPYLLNQPTRIMPSVTVTIQPGVNVFAAENAGLVIAGRLLATGTSQLPISFQSNERHPLNQTWLGLTAEPQGFLDLQNVTLDDASPAVSCLPDSQVNLSHLQIRRGSLGIFQSRTPCRISQSFLNGPTIGLVSVDSIPQVINSFIVSRKTDVIISSSATN